MKKPKTAKNEVPGVRDSKERIVPAKLSVEGVRRALFPEHGALPPLCKYQGFVTERWPRSRIKNLPRNPRKWSETAKRKMRTNLKSVKLTGPIKVNSVTGHCFSGHFKLAILDALQGGGDYSLDVAVNKLTPAQEKAQCIFENCPTAQGDWDLQVLGEFLVDAKNDDEFNVEDTGFGALDLETILGEAGQGLFGEEEQNEETRDAVADVEEALAARKEAQAAAKGRREKMRETAQQEREEHDTERIAYVMFPSRKAREDWVARLGLGRNERYVPHEAVKKLALPKGKR